eukprot:6052163-Amphidinium_carterae.1
MEQSEELRGWQQEEDVRKVKRKDSTRVKIMCMSRGQVGKKAELSLAVGLDPTLLTLPTVPMGSEIELHISDSSGNFLQSEPLLTVPAGPGPDPFNGVVA